MKRLKPLRAALYARYSTAGQRDKSIEDQIAEILEAAPKWNVEVDPQLYYIDRAHSGHKMSRRDFQRMLADAQAGLFDVLIVWKLSRIARNNAGQVSMLEDFKEWGVRVIAVGDNYDSQDDKDWMKAAWLGMQNESYCRLTSDDVTKGQKNTRLAGYHTGDCPYGIASIDSGLEMNRRGVLRPVGKLPVEHPIEVVGAKLRARMPWLQPSAAKPAVEPLKKVG